MQDKTRIVVLISGNGSNLQALIDACGTEKLPDAEIVRVICNKKTAYGLERAAKAGIPTTYHSKLPFTKKYPGDAERANEEFCEGLATHILAATPHLVVCAGWMLILSASFVATMEKSGIPIINLHPSLPGIEALKGANAIGKAYDMFQRGEISETGCMIHDVIAEIDSGAPLLSVPVPIRDSDSLPDLEARIHEHEWVAIVEGTRLAVERLKRGQAGVGRA